MTADLLHDLHKNVFPSWLSVYVVNISNENMHINVGETGAKWYTGQNETARFSYDDAIYDVSYSNWMRVLKIVSEYNQ